MLSQLLPDTTPAVTTSAPLLLVPTAIETMIAQRRGFQVAKFRTTCTDCVPNL